MTTVNNYEGRVWTCDEHDKQIVALITFAKIKEAKDIVESVHPKKGNSCRECSRLWQDTPSINR